MILWVPSDFMILFSLAFSLQSALARKFPPFPTPFLSSVLGHYPRQWQPTQPRPSEEMASLPQEEKNNLYSVGVDSPARSAIQGSHPFPSIVTLGQYKCDFLRPFSPTYEFFYDWFQFGGLICVLQPLCCCS